MSERERGRARAGGVRASESKSEGEKVGKQAERQRDKLRPTYNHEHRTILRYYANLMNPSARSIHVPSCILSIHLVTNIWTFLLFEKKNGERKKTGKKTCGQNMSSRELLLALPRELLRGEDFQLQRIWKIKPSKIFHSVHRARLQFSPEKLSPRSISLHKQHRTRPLLPSPQEPPTENG